MKKIFFIIMSILIIFSFTACGSDIKTEESTSEPTFVEEVTPEEEKPTVSFVITSVLNATDKFEIKEINETNFIFVKCDKKDETITYACEKDKIQFLLDEHKSFSKDGPSFKVGDIVEITYDAPDMTVLPIPITIKDIDLAQYEDTK